MVTHPITAAPTPSEPATPSPADHSSVPPHAAHDSLRKLVLLATGVVFGDIGTSPLYAIKECVDPDHGVAATRDNLFGVVSLVFWSLTMVVGVKYLTFIMRADNRGEGGILALLALVPRARSATRRGSAGWPRWSSLAPRFSMAMASSHPPSRSSARSKASASPRRG